MFGVTTHLYRQTKEFRALVDQSMIYPSSSRALRSQTWLRNAMQEDASIYQVIETRDTTYCVVLGSPIWLLKAHEPERGK